MIVKTLYEIDRWHPPQYQYMSGYWDMFLTQRYYDSFEQAKVMMDKYPQMTLRIIKVTYEVVERNYESAQ